MKALTLRSLSALMKRSAFWAGEEGTPFMEMSHKTMAVNILGRTPGCSQTAERRRTRGHARLTVAKGTMATSSFWLTKTSDTAVSVVPFRGYSTCQAMGWVPERLLKLAISKFICTTSLNELLLLEGSGRKQC